MSVCEPPDSFSRMAMMARTLGHDMPATLARIITPSVQLSTIMFSAVSTETPASAASPALVSSNLPCSAKVATWNSLSRPSSCSDFTSARAISVCLVMAAARDLDQGRLVQALRLRQHGAGDLDDLVERERADDPGRRGCDRRQPVGEQRLGRRLDLFDQALEYVVEQPHMIVGVVHRIVDE